MPEYATSHLRLIAVIWGVFAVIWLASALTAKRNVRSEAQMRGMWLRVIGLVLLVVIGRSNALEMVNAAYVPVRGAGMIGVALTALGIAFAVWARVHIGRNWGMPMSKKADPELVTSGPYAYVRHPIYGGMIVAFVGSTLVTAGFLLFLVPGLAYFLYSASVEERMWTKELPDAYPAYMRRTKRFIPFVW